MRESVPVSVEDGGGVATEQRYLVGKLAALVEGDNGEGATTARLPVDGQVLGVGLGVGETKTRSVYKDHGRYRQGASGGEERSSIRSVSTGRCLPL